MRKEEKREREDISLYLRSHQKLRREPQKKVPIEARREESLNKEEMLPKCYKDKDLN